MTKIEAENVWLVTYHYKYVYLTIVWEFTVDIQGMVFS